MSNMDKLGSILDKRMKKTSGAAVGITAELGIINSNMSLTPDSLGVPIPKGQYMVDITLISDTYDTEPPNGGTSSHEHRLPEAFRSIKAGDRVLIVWCGNEPVVTSIVTTS